LCNTGRFELFGFSDAYSESFGSFEQEMFWGARRPLIPFEHQNCVHKNRFESVKLHNLGGEDGISWLLWLLTFQNQRETLSKKATLAAGRMLFKQRLEIESG
jgi:hypothetical protein